MKPVRVLIVDDHEIVRVGLRTVLSRGDRISVVGEAATVTDAVTESCHLQPDVVLMDVRLSGGSAVDACRAIRDSCPATRVLFFPPIKTMKRCSLRSLKGRPAIC